MDFYKCPSMEFKKKISYGNFRKSTEIISEILPRVLQKLGNSLKNSCVNSEDFFSEIARVVLSEISPSKSPGIFAHL